jgi:hypothetical protein
VPGALRAHNKPVSDRVYLVLEGERTFYFGGEEGQEREMVPVGKDDASLILEGTIYGYEGRMRLILSHSPSTSRTSASITTTRGGRRSEPPKGPTRGCRRWLAGRACGGDLAPRGRVGGGGLREVAGRATGPRRRDRGPAGAPELP